MKINLPMSSPRVCVTGVRCPQLVASGALLHGGGFDQTDGVVRMQSVAPDLCERTSRGLRWVQLGKVAIIVNLVQAKGKETVSTWFGQREMEHELPCRLRAEHDQPRRPRERALLITCSAARASAAGCSCARHLHYVHTGREAGDFARFLSASLSLVVWTGGLVVQEGFPIYPPQEKSSKVLRDTRT